MGMNTAFYQPSGKLQALNCNIFRNYRTLNETKKHRKPIKIISTPYNAREHNATSSKSTTTHAISKIGIKSVAITQQNAAKEHSLTKCVKLSVTTGTIII